MTSSALSLTRTITNIRVGLAALLSLTLTLLIASPASATAQVGSWWTGHYLGCNNLLDSQGHYVNQNISGTLYTRADGWSVTVTQTNWRLDKIVVSQYSIGIGGAITQQGSYTHNLPGTITTSSLTGVSTTYLPFKPASSNMHMSVAVTMHNFSGSSVGCSAGDWAIGQ